MSSLFSLFIFYIAVIFAIRAFKKKATDNSRNSGTPTKSAQQSAEVFRTPQPVQPRTSQTQSRTAVASSLPHSATSASSTSQTKKPAAAKSEPPKHSTIGYLHEKAKLDEEEHRKEEAETARKMKQRSDGRIPGKQLLLGDPVPANCKCVVCGYCAAENLIPLNSREKYCCYFCREAL